MPFNRKRQQGRGGGGGGRGKRKKLNLLTIRQTKDYEEFGELHPVDDLEGIRNYTTVKDTQRTDEKEENLSSSSEDEEEEIPVIKQLLNEIGVEDKAPESEQESSSDEDAEEDDDVDSNIGDNEVDDSDSDIGDDEENDLELSSTKEEDIEELSEGSDADEENENLDESEENRLDANQLDEDKDGIENEDDVEISDDDDDNLCLKESDPFTKHYEVDHDLDHLSDTKEIKWKKSAVKVPGLGKSTLIYQDSDLLADVETNQDLKKLYVKQKLIDQVGVANKKHCDIKTNSLTSLQHKLFQVINSYQDLLFTKQTYQNMEELRLVYCLHALNHVLKARSRVVSHNASLKANKSKSSEDDKEYRDQGLTRPRVLILLPYRDRALKIVHMIITLLSSSKVKVHSQSRFEGEFSELEDSGLDGKSYKPDDFKKMFEGNTDDNFRVGLNVSKNTVHLYSQFYDADIILASPLGLRAVIGLEGDKDRDFDFLSSIELLLVDQTDVFLMQNWDHFTHVMKHLHLQPREFHGVDFSRVRMWAINGWSKFYRQTIIMTSVILPEILTVFNKMCFNFSGKVMVHRDPEKGTIQSSLYDSPQFFHRVACESPNGLSQRLAKFEYLKKKVIPYHRSAGMKQTLIYCNYHSFVQLRNYFREAEIDFLFINEYDSEKHIRNARIHFRKRHPHFMLYTERLHFHYRFRLRGIHHIIWFDLPQYPMFYPELLNLMDTNHQACTSTSVFTRFEGQKLLEIVGSKQAAHMINSEKSVNMITVS